MNTQAVMLAAPYRRQVGKVTFEVTAYADAAANQTAEQMLLHLLERQIEKKQHQDRKYRPAHGHHRLYHQTHL